VIDFADVIYAQSKRRGITDVWDWHGKNGTLEFE
jgi:hypothetical protein